MPLSSCDEIRLKTAEEADKKLGEARALYKEEKYERALEAYLFAFDYSRFVSGWGGVRLSYIPSEIAQMGKVYPLAKTALVQRRDARERLILAGETDYDLVAEWTSINHYLGESVRELDVLKSLKNIGKDSEKLKERIVDSNFEYLLEQQEYSLLSLYINQFGRKFLNSIFHYETEIMLPGSGPWPPERMKEYWKEIIRKEGAQVYEVALGSKNGRIADEIAQRVLTYCNDAKSFIALTKAADRAGQKKRLNDLTRLAKTSLSPDELRIFRDNSKKT